MITTPVLVINSGSSSLKFSLFDMVEDREIISGVAERLNGDDPSLSWRTGDGRDTLTLERAGHDGALAEVGRLVAELKELERPPVAVGHRVVHGGEAFSDSVLIDDDVIRGIERCASLAPLHNPANLQGIRAMQALYPNVPQVAVFDTAFHQSLAEEAYLYALPMALYRDHGIRRYGFHGTSHKYVGGQAVRRLNLDPDDHCIISAHLGNGCSAAAIRNGRSIDTTMGLTPLEGLVMGTRSGDVDPGLHQFLAQQLGWSLAEVTDMLNRDSGLRGLSGLSNDMRSLSAAAAGGDAHARRAIDVFCFRLARQLGGLAASLGRLDALVFTGGIGENAVQVRADVLNRLSIFGFHCDTRRNDSPGAHDGRITTDGSTPAVVIPTREEWMIAQDAQRLAQSSST